MTSARHTIIQTILVKIVGLLAEQFVARYAFQFLLFQTILSKPDNSVNKINPIHYEIYSTSL